MKTYVYVDGFNLYYAIKSLSGSKWLNLKELAQQVVPTAAVDKVRYFTARVSGAVDPGAPGRQQVYLNALRTVPEVEFHFGNFLAKGQWRPVLMLPIAQRSMTDASGFSATCLQEFSPSMLTQVWQRVVPKPFWSEATVVEELQADPRRGQTPLKHMSLAWKKKALM